jgi:hypothetical protein
MIKGLQKKIIVVQSPDPEIFEQAIFILKDDADKRQKVSKEQLLLQAQAAANPYMHVSPRKTRFGWLSRIPRAVFAACGAVAAALAWIAAKFVGV